MQIFPDSQGIMEKEKTVRNPSVLKVGQVKDQLEDIDSKRANILTTDETEKSSSLKWIRDVPPAFGEKYTGQLLLEIDKNEIYSFESRFDANILVEAFPTPWWNRILWHCFMPRSN